MTEGSDKIYENTKSGIYTFSQPKFYMFFVKNGEKIYFILILFMISVAIAADKDLSFLNRLAQGIIFFGILLYLIGRILRKFAYKILINFETKRIEFYMNRSEEVIATDFDEIKNIRINGYLVFIFKKNKIFYSGAINDAIVTSLNSIKKVERGFLCSLLGPKGS